MPWFQEPETTALIHQESTEDGAAKRRYEAFNLSMKLVVE